MGYAWKEKDWRRLEDKWTTNMCVCMGVHKPLHHIEGYRCLHTNRIKQMLWVYWIDLSFFEFSDLKSAQIFRKCADFLDEK